MAQDKPTCEKHGSELFNSLEKGMKNKNLLTQTLNESTVYEPVLSLKSKEDISIIKVVSPPCNSQRAERGCRLWAGFGQKMPCLQRSHVPQDSLSDRMTFLGLDYQDRLSWDRILSTTTTPFFKTCILLKFLYWEKSDRVETLVLQI